MSEDKFLQELIDACDQVLYIEEVKEEEWPYSQELKERFTDYCDQIKELIARIGHIEIEHGTSKEQLKGLIPALFCTATTGIVSDFYGVSDQHPEINRKLGSALDDIIKEIESKK